MTKLFLWQIKIILALIIIKRSSCQNKETFICVDGNEIKFVDVCNGKKDCPDGSDETRTLCYHIICPVDDFRCFYGACIKKSAKCNGVQECADNSDESQCGRKEGSCS